MSATWGGSGWGSTPWGGGGSGTVPEGLAAIVWQLFRSATIGPLSSPRPSASLAPAGRSTALLVTRPPLRAYGLVGVGIAPAHAAGDLWPVARPTATTTQRAGCSRFATLVRRAAIAAGTASVRPRASTTARMTVVPQRLPSSVLTLRPGLRAEVANV